MAKAFPVETLMMLVMPLIIPAAMIPGNKGMKILAIFCKKRCSGLSCFCLLALLLILVRFSTSIV